MTKLFTIIPLFILLISCQSEKEQLYTSTSLIDSSGKIKILEEGIISTSLYERDIAISPDGNELIYTLGDYKQTRRCLVRLTKKDGNWGTPEILNISGQYQDIEPFLADGGNTLFFASNRPIFNDENRKDYNIWYSERNGQIWSDPTPLDTIINSRRDEFYPSLSDNGNLYFTATREDGVGREDIFISKRVDGQYQSPEPLPEEINTSLFEFNAFISPDEKYIIFSSFGREGGLGGGDLYISQKDENGQWQKSRNLGPEINSENLDFCPFVDRQSKFFYFTSERLEVNNTIMGDVKSLVDYSNSTLNGYGNIYKAFMRSLLLK